MLNYLKQLKKKYKSKIHEFNFVPLAFFLFFFFAFCLVMSGLWYLIKKFLKKTDVLQNLNNFNIDFIDCYDPSAYGAIILHDNLIFLIIFISLLVTGLLIDIFKKYIITAYNPNFNLNLYNFFYISLYLKKYKENVFLEFLWTLFPGIFLTILAFPSIYLLYAIEERIDPAIVIKVIGNQWYWLYEYNTYFNFESHFITDNDLPFGELRMCCTSKPLFLPTNTHIQFIITANDVIHSWAVPALGIKVDAIPGRLNTVNTYISNKGHFFGMCSELCGAGHAYMPIEIISVSPFTFFNIVSLKI